MYNSHTYINYCLPGIPGELSVFLSLGNGLLFGAPGLVAEEVEVNENPASAQ
jgi:hypothetical protein